MTTSINHQTLCIDDLPRIMSMNNSEVILNSKLLSTNDIESLEDIDENMNKVETLKFKATGYGSWDLHINVIKADHFENRNQLDQLFFYDDTPDRMSQNIQRISIENALKFTGVEITIDMDFYLKNKDVLETDLKRSVTDSDLQNLKKIEQELFYNQMCTIFGKQNDEGDYVKGKKNNKDDSFEKSFILRQFHKYTSGGNLYGSSKRGDYYFLFSYYS
jgi:hypothetical protein